MFLLIRFNNLSIVNLSSSMSLLVVSCISFSSSFELRYAEFSFSLLFPPENIFMHSSHLTLFDFKCTEFMCFLSVCLQENDFEHLSQWAFVDFKCTVFMWTFSQIHAQHVLLMHPFCVFYTHILHIQIF